VNGHDDNHSVKKQTPLPDLVLASEVCPFGLLY